MTDVAPVDRWLPGTLAFTAGFVDTCAFVALLGLFSAHVTGNFVLLGASLVRPHAGLIAKLLALPMFMLTVALTRWSLIRFPSLGVRGILLGEGVFLVLFLAAGVSASPIHDADEPSAILAAMLAVVAMGIQNAASRTLFATLSPTTVMTGNVTQVTIDAVDMMAAPTPEAKAAARVRIVKFAPPLFTFALGAVAGALGFGTIGFWCLGLPVLALSVLWVRNKQSSRSREENRLPAQSPKTRNE